MILHPKTRDLHLKLDVCGWHVKETFRERQCMLVRVTSNGYWTNHRIGWSWGDDASGVDSGLKRPVAVVGGNW